MTTASAAKTRKALHAYVSDDAHDRWHTFAATHGVSLSATLEVLATELSTQNNEPVQDRLEEVVRLARKTDAQRRRRRR